MKFRIMMNDPAGIEADINEAMFRITMDDPDGIENDAGKPKNSEEFSSEFFKAFISPWIKNGCVVLEFDTNDNTARIVPVSEDEPEDN